MALSNDLQAHSVAGDARALAILAKTLYRELRQSGLSEADVMTVAGELLSLVAADVRERRPAPRSR